MTLTAFRLWIAPYYLPKARKEKGKNIARRIARDIKRAGSSAISARFRELSRVRAINLSPGASGTDL